MTHSDLRMASRRWTSQKPTKIATASQFAAPSGTARPHSDVLVAPLFWVSQDPPNLRQFRSSQPPGTAKLHSDLRMTRLRWASQEPTNVATVSQFTAPRDGEVLF